MKNLLLILVAFVLLFGCTSSQAKPENKNSTSMEKTENKTDGKPFVPVATCNGSSTPDIYNEGFVVLGDKKITDHCIDISTVEENYCNGSLVQINRTSCPEGYQCYFGKCTAKKNVVCTDSDRNDLFTKGNVELNGEVREDVCTARKNVREYTCKDNQIYSAIFECPDKTDCIDGKCIKKEIICTDDDGYNISTFGKVTIDDNSGFLDVHEDKCNNNLLTEYYCNANRLASENVTCPTLTQCVNGYCKPNTNSTGCTDSDGITREIAGSVVASGKLYVDTCITDSSVLEYYCQGNEVKSAVLPCIVISGNSRCIAARCTVQ